MQFIFLLMSGPRDSE
uniref:Uncharacterized protein n=1 Tax=Moniliophthora roreri TaxID=221103 RepID=A0A0W0FD46_MONRR